MKSAVIVFGIASLMASTTLLASSESAQFESSKPTQNISVAAASAKPDRDARYSKPAPDRNQAREANNTLPDPALMPYLNGGYYDAK